MNLRWSFFLATFLVLACNNDNDNKLDLPVREPDGVNSSGKGCGVGEKRDQEGVTFGFFKENEQDSVILRICDIDKRASFKYERVFAVKDAPELVQSYFKGWVAFDTVKYSQSTREKPFVLSLATNGGGLAEWNRMADYYNREVQYIVGEGDGPRKPMNAILAVDFAGMDSVARIGVVDRVNLVGPARNEIAENDLFRLE